jgi:hypothetical protein
MVIFLPMSYLLQFIYCKKNYNNYYEQKINIIYFIQAKEYDMILYAKF